MKAIMDLHTHTLAAGHAYSTLLENIDAALAVGIRSTLSVNTVA